MAEIGDGWFIVNTDQTFHNGDGVCFYDAHGEILGMRINRAEGKQSSYPAEMPEELSEGATLFRNRDQEFERALEKESAERRVSVKPVFAETADGFRLTLTDEDGVTVAVNLPKSGKIGHEIAQNPEPALAKLQGKPRQVRQHHVQRRAGRTATDASRGSCRSAPSTPCAAKPPKHLKPPASPATRARRAPNRQPTRCPTRRKN